MKMFEQHREKPYQGGTSYFTLWEVRHGLLSLCSLEVTATLAFTNCPYIKALRVRYEQKLLTKVLVTGMVSTQTITLKVCIYISQSMQIYYTVDMPIYYPFIRILAFRKKKTCHVRSVPNLAGKYTRALYFDWVAAMEHLHFLKWEIAGDTFCFQLESIF